MEQRTNIFFSWQSNSPKETNQNALRSILSQIQGELIEEDITVYNDEATRDTPGSPNIPDTIFKKIDNADIFICDLTTINTHIEIEDEKYRPTPNPNVLIELGYAILSLGWERIIMLFNTTHGNFPNDIPFDIDRQRITTYKVTDKSDKSGKGSTKAILKQAIKKIVHANPAKPSELKVLTEEEIIRKRDINSASMIMSKINIIAFDNFLSEFPEIIPVNMLIYQIGFRELLHSNTFHLYDKPLKDALHILDEKLDKSLSYGKYYHTDSYVHKFGHPNPKYKSTDEKKAFKELCDLKSELELAFKDLLVIIREKYVTIDLNTTTNTALKEYNSFMK